MKIRAGYVSNSSSSSFLVVYNRLEDFDCLKNEPGYSFFISDIQCSCSDNKIVEFFDSKLDELAWYETKNRRGILVVRMHTPSTEWLSMFFDSDTPEKKQTKKIVAKVKELAYARADAATSRNWDKEVSLSREIGELCEEFGKLMLQVVKNSKWQYVNVVEYSDEVDDGYMENEFMPTVQYCGEENGTFYSVDMNNH